MRRKCKECGRRISHGNRSGYCYRHHQSKKIEYGKLEQPACKDCGVRITVETSTGYCQAHYADHTERAHLARDRRERAFAIIAEAAERGEVCPRNADIARAIGYRNSNSVSCALNLLEAEGRIEIESGAGRRAVRIVATDQWTQRHEPPKWLREYNPTPRRPVRQIIDIATHIFGVRAVDMCSRSRAAWVSRARYAVFTVAHEQTWPKTHIGRIFSFDHSSIIHGIHRAGELAAQDEIFAARLDALRQQAAPAQPVRLAA